MKKELMMVNIFLALDPSRQPYWHWILDLHTVIDLCPPDVPERVLSKVKHVITVATEGKTTLFKASELLEFTMEPFQYARRAAQDNFDLSRQSVDSLKSYDNAFTKMMSARLDSDMTMASSCEESCFRHLGKYRVYFPC